MTEVSQNDYLLTNIDEIMEPLILKAELEIQGKNQREKCNGMKMTEMLTRLALMKAREDRCLFEKECQEIISSE